MTNWITVVTRDIDHDRILSNEDIPIMDRMVYAVQVLGLLVARLLLLFFVLLMVLYPCLLALFYIVTTGIVYTFAAFMVYESNNMIHEAYSTNVDA